VEGSNCEKARLHAKTSYYPSITNSAADVDK